MFLYIVSWIFFVPASVILLVIFSDILFQWTVPASQKARGIRAEYSFYRTLIVLVIWVLTGWYIFG